MVLVSDRKYALVLLVLAGLYIYGGFNTPVAFASDPVGPGNWIIFVGLAIGVLACALLVFATDEPGDFPQFAQWQERLPLILAIGVYSYALPVVGFVFANPILGLVIARMFGARWLHAVIAGSLITLACVLIFDYGLGVSLPKARWLYALMG